VGAFDQARDVRNDEANFVFFAHPDHAKIRLERRERVIGNLGTRGGDARDQRGLANVGKPDKADVSQELEFETEDALFSGAAFFMFARSLMGRGGEAGIAPAAATSVSDDDALVGLGEVPDFIACLFVVNDGTDGDFQNDVDAFAAGAVRAFAVASALGLLFGIETEVDERVVALAGFHDDVATLAAVPARGAPAGDKLLPAESETAVAAVAGFDSDCGFVDKHGNAGLRC
jgi:CBS domain-containing protein